MLHFPYRANDKGSIHYAANSPCDWFVHINFRFNKISDYSTDEAVTIAMGTPFCACRNLSFLTCDPYPIRYDILKGFVQKFVLFPIMHWGHNLDFFC